MKRLYYQEGTDFITLCQHFKTIFGNAGWLIFVQKIL